MNFNYQQLLPSDFSNDSRVWIYQSPRLFNPEETTEIEAWLQDFVSHWESHGIPVKGYGRLLFGQFLILMADESATSISGCSTDSSVRLIKQIEQRFKVGLFDRQLLAFIVKGKIQLISLLHLTSAADNNIIDGETLYFNNLVQRAEELRNQWIIPVKDSWFVNRIPLKKTPVS